MAFDPGIRRADRPELEVAEELSAAEAEIERLDQAHGIDRERLSPVAAAAQLGLTVPRHGAAVARNVDLLRLALDVTATGQLGLGL